MVTLLEEIFMHMIIKTRCTFAQHIGTVIACCKSVPLCSLRELQWDRPTMLCSGYLTRSTVFAFPLCRNFNEICLDLTNRPHNPMLNAGAIMSCSLILELILPK
jgi:hypothetical protein